ncbi:MAG: hypothetical protein IKI87_08585 [Clostridiales bacterium]|nr:hypothetical protein [Clostridiales bacterium]
MNGKDMLEWMNELDDKAVTDADITPVKIKKHKGWKIGFSVAAGVLALAVLTYVLYPYIRGKKSTTSPDSSVGDDPSVVTQILKSYEMASPNYPVSLSIRSNGEKIEEYAEYYKDIVRTVLCDTNGENKVFSPLCMYMSLSMAAEISDGNSRQQILDVLHQPDIESSRAAAKSIWLANYLNSSEAKLLLANSLWMNSNWNFERSTLETLASEYFASSYSGDPIDPNYNNAYRDWLSEQTDGLLDDYLSTAGLEPSMVLTLVSAVNFSGTWTEPFNTSHEGVFHGTDGDVQTTFIEGAVSTYTGEHFVSAKATLEGNGSVRFILPEEGMTPEQLLLDEELMEHMNDISPKWDTYEEPEEDNGHTPYPKLVMPNNIDISSQLAFTDYLREMGITDVFEDTMSDFTPLTQEGKGSLSISSIEHTTRVMIDNIGCKAIALATVVVGYGDEPISDNKVVLDRPYIFEIVSETGLPLFIGIVNNI